MTDINRISKVLIFILVLLAFTSCAHMGQYFIDRGNDLADCFSFKAGLSYGVFAGVEVTDFTMLYIGYAYDDIMYGVIGRDFVREVQITRVGPPVVWVYLPTMNYGGEYFGMSICYSPFITGFVDSKEYHDNDYGFLFYSDKSGKKGVFSIDVLITIGIIGFDIGFNLVEFVDFALGIFTIDILDDDYNPKRDVKKKMDKSKQEKKATFEKENSF